MLSILARRTVRYLGFVASLPLAALYAIGVIAAAVVIVCLACVSAVRLGWSDTRKRATHGAA